MWSVKKYRTKRQPRVDIIVDELPVRKPGYTTINERFYLFEKLQTSLYLFL